MNTDRMGRCPAGEKAPNPSGFGAFLSETGQGCRNYSAVYRMRMVATCARVAVALGERVVSVVPEIRPSPMGPLHGVGGIGGYLIRVGEATQIAGDLNGIGIFKSANR